jgi:hypothetical protein
MIDRPCRKTFEVRWRVAGRDRSRSFTNRALADSYRTELVRAARTGRRAGYDHPAADPGNRPQAAGWDAARRLVRACLQRPAALRRSWTGHSQRAGLGGAGVPAGRPARRPARHPGLPWTGLCTRLDDLRRTLEERDEELAAAREANRTMMAELNHR